MSEFEYAPSSLSFPAGTTVEFTLVNDGTVPHDAYIGDEAAQEAHEVEMASMPAGHSHDMGAAGATVQPGRTATLTYTFEASGTVFVGCHQSGHWDSGMRLAIDVTD